MVHIQISMLQMPGTIANATLLSTWGVIELVTVTANVLLMIMHSQRLSALLEVIHHEFGTLLILKQYTQTMVGMCCLEMA